MEYAIGFRVESPDEVPDTVEILNTSDPRITESETLQRYLEEELPENRTYNEERINESEFENLRETFKSVPTYGWGEKATVPDSGSYSIAMYIHHDGDIIEIILYAERPG